MFFCVLSDGITHSIIGFSDLFRFRFNLLCCLLYAVLCAIAFIGFITTFLTKETDKSHDCKGIKEFLQTASLFRLFFFVIILTAIVLFFIIVILLLVILFVFQFVIVDYFFIVTIVARC